MSVNLVIVDCLSQKHRGYIEVTDKESGAVLRLHELQSYLD